MALVRGVRIVGVVAGGFMVLVTVAVGLAALPAPAAGGTCGPGTSSESAVQAFFDPVSIGAGARPSSGAALTQWRAFVGQCQTAADHRMIVVGVLLLVSLLLLVGAPWLLRRVDAAAPSSARRPPAGWYPDPGDPAGARWWDGATWGATWQPPP